MTTIAKPPCSIKSIAFGVFIAMNLSMPALSMVSGSRTDNHISSAQLSTIHTQQDIQPIVFNEILGVDESTGETLFIDIESDDFVLSQDQWFLIQAYAHSAFGLPTTEAAMKSALKFEDTLEFNSDYQTLLEEYRKIHGSATHWNTELYPSIVDLALQLANYSDIHLVFMQPLIDSLSSLVSQSSELQIIGLFPGEGSEEYANLTNAIRLNLARAKQYLSLLTTFSNSRLTAVEAAKTGLLHFSTELKEQSISLDVYSDTFEEVLSQDRTEQLRDRIDEINARIQEINRIIAKKKRDVGLTAIGGGVSLLIGGSILGSQIINLREEASTLRNEVDGLRGELAHAIALYESYSAATISIDHIDEKIETAIPHIEKLKLHWQSMSKEFGDIQIALDSAATEVGLENLDVLLGSVGTTALVGIAEDRWSAISNKAKDFVQNAYVTVE